MAAETVRTSLRLDRTTHERAMFWAQRVSARDGIKTSFNDFVASAIENEIARLSGAEIDADHILTARINQLTDAIKSMQSELRSMSTTNTVFAQLIDMARGDNVLMDAGVDDDGELDGV